MSLSNSANDAPESGVLPGRYEWVAEPSPGETPTDPDFQYFSDALRSFEAEVGASYGAQTIVGDPDTQDHFRGTEDPSASVGYDLQRFPVDGTGNAIDPSGYGIVRDGNNQLPGTLLIEGRREYPGGVNDTGVREYTIVRGATVETVTPELDPSATAPILMELDLQPRRVRSYKIEQPVDSGSILTVSSTNANDTMDITIESEGATTTETLTINGSTAVTGTSSFSDIDAAYLDAPPEGDVTIEDSSGNVLLTITGGLTYSGDDQPVDGDRGVPTLGAGSRGTDLGTTYEFFLGDRFERPVGSSVRPRVNSASWSVENDLNTQSLQTTRAPAVDEANRTVSIDADVGGRFMTHESMMESLQKDQSDLEHELSGGTITFKNTVPQDAASRSVEAEQAVASESETFGASGDPAIVLSAN